MLKQFTEVKRFSRLPKTVASKRRVVKTRGLDQLSTSFIHYKPVSTTEPLNEKNSPKEEEDGMPPKIETEGVRRIVSILGELQCH